mmetsp:Transcript_6817/g.5966  ORF Transcript_6817/g.5966 Transcript_6817/m.5966 type:complete len:219 (-) Transcript_6817:37-693(-)
MSRKNFITQTSRSNERKDKINVTFSKTPLLEESSSQRSRLDKINLNPYSLRLSEVWAPSRKHRNFMASNRRIILSKSLDEDKKIERMQKDLKNKIKRARLVNILHQRSFDQIKVNNIQQTLLKVKSRIKDTELNNPVIRISEGSFHSLASSRYKVIPKNVKPLYQNRIIERELNIKSTLISKNNLLTGGFKNSPTVKKLPKLQASRMKISKYRYNQRN